MNIIDRLITDMLSRTRSPRVKQWLRDMAGGTKQTAQTPAKKQRRQRRAAA